MDSIFLSCPNCKKKLKVKTEYMGKKIGCKCGQKILVPVPPSVPVKPVMTDFDLPSNFDTKVAATDSKSGENWEPVEVESESTRENPRLENPPYSVVPPHPMLSLFSLAIASGLLFSSIMYAMTWKFAAPIWVYGSFLIPVSVTLLVLSYYAFSKSRNDRLSVLSLIIAVAFCAMTLVAGIGTIYDVWTAEQRAKNMIRDLNKSFMDADRGIKQPRE
jgi:hypothetical protein